MAIGNMRRNSPGWLPQHLELIVRDDPNMKKLRLSLPKYEREFIRAYVRSMQDNKYLEDLWLDGDSMDIDVSLSLAAALRVNTRLKILRIRNCIITGSGASAIFDALTENTTMQELYLERNQLTKYAVKTLCALLRKNKTLRILHLNHNSSIGSKGAEQIFEAMRRNTGLEEICFEKSGIESGNCADSIGRMALRNRTLRRLQLIHTKLKEKDLILLAKYLEHNKVIEQVVITGCSISEKAALALGDLLKTTKTLQRLCLWGNDLKDNGVKALSGGIEVNTSLTEIRIMMNSVKDEGAIAIAHAVKHHQLLHQVDLPGNSIEVAGGNALAECVEYNDKIVGMGLHGNQFLGNSKDVIGFWLRLNKGGRRLIRKVNLPPTEFIEALAKNEQETDLAYYLIRERPDMLKM